jgi:hypothetical protein
MRLARVIGMILIALSGASLSGCVIANTGKWPFAGGGKGSGPSATPAGRSEVREVVVGGHAHVICHDNKVWLQNYNPGPEVEDGAPFLAEEQPSNGCGPNKLMHPAGREHQVGYRTWLHDRR